MPEENQESEIKGEKRKARPKKEKAAEAKVKHKPEKKEEAGLQAQKERPIKPIAHVKPKEGIELVGKKENPLLKREEIEAIIYHGGKPTPNRPQIHESVSVFLKANKDLVIVDRVYSKAGLAATGAKILLYKSRQDIPKGKLERMAKQQPKEGKAEGDAKAGEKQSS